MVTSLTAMYPLLLRALGTALLHSLWQGLLLFAVLLLLLAVVPKRNASLRYLSGYATLSLLLSMFLLTTVLEFQELARNSMESATMVLTSSTTRTPGNRISARFFDQFSLPAGSKLLPYLSLMYFLGIALFQLKLIRDGYRLRKLRKGNIDATGDLKHKFIALATALIPGKKIRLQLTDKLNIPVIFGHIKPVILIPIALLSGLSPDQLETVLLHELAHIKRRDYLLNLIQTVMETLLFFNPATWLISRRIRVEREHCCDDFVVRKIREPLPYAKALVALAAIRGQGMQPALAATGVEKSSLFNRIKRITDMKQSTQKSQKVIVAMTVFFLSISLACFFTAFSQPAPRAKMTNEDPTASVQSPVFGPQGEPEPEVADRPAMAIAGLQQRTQQKPGVRYSQGNAIQSEQTQTPIPQNEMEDFSKETLQLAQEALTLAQTEVAKVDWEGIQQTVSASMEAIDWEEIGQTIERSLSEVDWEQIESKVSEAMELQGTTAAPNLKAELTEARRTMQQELKAGREEAKKQLAVAREELKTARIRSQQELKDAREQIESARREIQAASQEQK